MVGMFGCLVGVGGHAGFVDAMPSVCWCRGHRYSVVIISRCVWLYHRFPLSAREVEEMVTACGVLSRVGREDVHSFLVALVVGEVISINRDLVGTSWAGVSSVGVVKGR